MNDIFRNFFFGNGEIYVINNIRLLSILRYFSFIYFLRENCLMIFSSISMILLYFKTSAFSLLWLIIFFYYSHPFRKFISFFKSRFFFFLKICFSICLSLFSPAYEAQSYASQYTFLFYLQSFFLTLFFLISNCFPFLLSFLHFFSILVNVIKFST